MRMGELVFRGLCTWGALKHRAMPHVRPAASPPPSPPLLTRGVATSRCWDQPDEIGRAFEKRGGAGTPDNGRDDEWRWSLGVARGR